MFLANTACVAVNLKGGIQVDRSNGVWELAEQARREKKWLYDSGFKRWYSPDEFFNSFAPAKYSLLTFLQGVKLRDPFEAIELANQDIEKRQKNVEGFTARVISYYRNKAVDKPQGQY